MKKPVLIMTMNWMLRKLVFLLVFKHILAKILGSNFFISRNSERSRAENGVFDEENSLIMSARGKRIETNFKNIN